MNPQCWECHFKWNGWICSWEDPQENLRPGGKGCLAELGGAWHENTMMLRMCMLPNLLLVTTCRWCLRGGLSHGQTVWTSQLGGGGGRGGMGVVKCGVSCDWKFQRPSWQKLAFVTWFLRPKITMFPLKKNVKQLRHFRMRDVIATSHVYNVSV